MSNQASLNELKARALIAGFMRDSVVNARSAGSLADAATEFAALLAMMTSADQQHRSDAKKRIKELATAGGWKWTTAPVLAESSQNPETSSTDAPAPVKRKAGTWSNEEKKLVADRWRSADYPKDGQGVTELCGATGRSGLAIIIRLFQESLVSLEEGDNLCRQMQLDRLLSETNVADNHA